jgi:hypothetical protein
MAEKGALRHQWTCVEGFLMEQRELAAISVGESPTDTGGSPVLPTPKL